MALVVVSVVCAGHASVFAYSGSSGFSVTRWRTFARTCHSISCPGWAVP